MGYSPEQRAHVGLQSGWVTVRLHHLHGSAYLLKTQRGRGAQSHPGGGEEMGAVAGLSWCPRLSQPQAVGTAPWLPRLASLQPRHCLQHFTLIIIHGSGCVSFVLLTTFAAWERRSKELLQPELAPHQGQRDAVQHPTAHSPQCLQPPWSCTQIGKSLCAMGSCCRQHSPCRGFPSSPPRSQRASATPKSPVCLLGEPPPGLSCAQGLAVSLHWCGWCGTARHGSVHPKGLVSPLQSGKANRQAMPTANSASHDGNLLRAQSKRGAQHLRCRSSP